MKIRNWITLLFIILLSYSLLSACSFGIDSSETVNVDNPNSDLLPLLLNKDDFSSKQWKLDTTEIMQNDDVETADEIVETARYWIAARYIPSNDFFRITHDILRYNDPSDINFDNLTMFSYEPQKTREIDSMKLTDFVQCASYNRSKFQECAFVKKHDKFVSILTFSYPDSFSEDELKKIATQFITKIDARIGLKTQ
jgi:hypothetical protein